MVEKSVKELKLTARELKIKGYYKMSKGELIDAIISTREEEKKLVTDSLFQRVDPRDLRENDLVRVRGISDDLEIARVVKMNLGGATLYIKTGVKKHIKVRVSFEDIGKVVVEELAKESIVKNIEDRKLIPYLDPSLNVRLSEKETLFLTKISNTVRGYNLGMGIYKISAKSINYYVRSV